MPSNPRDHLGANDPVPLTRVRDAIADAMAGSLAGRPAFREALAGAVIERLLCYRLLAPDVEGMLSAPRRVILPPPGDIP